MKLFVLITVTLISATHALAANLACWDLYARSGAAPAFTATIQNNNSLTNIRLLVNKGIFGPFDKSGLVSAAKGIEITSNRSPYRGNQNFLLTEDADIRVILPFSLDSESVQNTIFKAGNLPANLAQRQNGVIEVAGRRHHSGGSIFIRMHCVSK